MTGALRFIDRHLDEAPAATDALCSDRDRLGMICCKAYSQSSSGRTVCTQRARLSVPCQSIDHTIHMICRRGRDSSLQLISLLLTFCISMFSSNATAHPVINATLSSDQIFPGETVRVSVELKGGSIAVSAAELGAVDIVLILDFSSSMYRDTAAMREAVDVFLTSLEPSRVRVGAVAFSDEARLLSPLTNNFQSISNAVASEAAWGTTNIAAGLVMGADVLDLLNGSDQRRRLAILITDGMPTPDARAQSGEFSRVVKELEDAGVPVHTVGLRGEVDVFLLESIAHQTGGTFSIASSPEVIRDLLVDIRSSRVFAADVVNISIYESIHPRLSVVPGSFVLVELPTAIDTTSFHTELDVGLRRFYTEGVITFPLIERLAEGERVVYSYDLSIRDAGVQQGCDLRQGRGPFGSAQEQLSIWYGEAAVAYYLLGDRTAWFPDMALDVFPCGYFLRIGDDDEWPEIVNATNLPIWDVQTEFVRNGRDEWRRAVPFVLPSRRFDQSAREVLEFDPEYCFRDGFSLTFSYPVFLFSLSDYEPAFRVVSDDLEAGRVSPATLDVIGARIGVDLTGAGPFDFVRLFGPSEVGVDGWWKLDQSSAWRWSPDFLGRFPMLQRYASDLVAYTGYGVGGRTPSCFTIGSILIRSWNGTIGVFLEQSGEFDLSVFR